MNCLQSFAVSFAGILMSISVSPAAVITFDNYISSNGSDKLAPLVTVSDDPVGSFLVSVTHIAPSDGHLNLIAFDLGAATFSSGDVSNVKNDGVALTMQSPCTNTGSTQVSSGKYCFGTSVPVGGNSNNINPFDTSAFDLVLAFFNNDSIADLGSILTFNISDLGGLLKLSDFALVGLRYQSANNVAGSDKLIGTVSPVPVPPAFLLFGTALVGMAGFNRLKRRRTMAGA